MLNMAKNDIQRDTFTFYQSWEQGISKLQSIEARESVYKGIVRYSLFGEEPEVTDPMAIMCWELIKPVIDKARVRAFVSSCEKPALLGNQNALKKNEKRTKNEQKTIKVKDKVKDNYISFESSGEEQKQETSALTPEQISFLNLLREKYPSVMKMKQPLTIEQCQKLKVSYTPEQINSILEDMENMNELNKKYKSAYLTANKWLQRNYGNK